MKRTLLTLLIATAILQGTDVPKFINYQGKLFSGSLPVIDTVSIQYALYDSPDDGNLLWSQVSPAVPVVNGIFSDTLGRRIDTVLTRYSEVWLQITVNGTVLLPREQLCAAAFALNVADSVITDAKVLWGEGNGVSAEDIPCMKLETYFNATNLQDAIEEISRKGDQGTPKCSSASYRLFTNF